MFTVWTMTTNSPDDKVELKFRTTRSFRADFKAKSARHGLGYDEFAQQLLGFIEENQGEWESYLQAGSQRRYSGATDREI